MSLVLSSVVVMLMSTVFVVQTDFYESQLQRSSAQDNARAVTEIISTELRSAMSGAVLVANDSQLVIRSPLALGSVCAINRGRAYIHFEGGEAELDTDAMAGMAEYDEATGTWDYQATTWRNIDSTRGDEAQTCAGEGTDTTGISDEFNRFRRLANLFGSNPDVGSIVMFYRETEFLLTTSALDSTVVGLYKGTYGDALVEFASGMDDSAQFLYRLSGATSYASPVADADLGDIDAVRLVAATRARAPGGGQDDIVAGWSVNVPLRNAN